MKTQRQIIFHENYFLDFYLEQSEKVQEKIEYVFKILRTVQNVPKKFLDHMTGTDGLYEIRVEMESNIYLTDFRKNLKRRPRKKLIWL